MKTNYIFLLTGEDLNKMLGHLAFWVWKHQSRAKQCQFAVLGLVHMGSDKARHAAIYLFVFFLYILLSLVI